MEVTMAGQGPAKSYKDLRVWQNAMEVGMLVFEHSKRFPPEERYSLTDQIRRSSRSIATNVAEGWKKRRYVAAFVSKLNDSEGEAAETQNWVEFARRCHYWNDELARELDQRYDEIMSQLQLMIRDADRWCDGMQ
jgi:four helix bundle protein